MKLKFRISKKDLKIFVVFMIILFYLICIAILNFSSLFSNGTWSGFNPLPALEGNYLPGVLVIFLGVLFASISAASSTIFNREKGVGFKIAEKKESGYSRWADKKEIKKGLTCVYADDKDFESAGMPIVSNGDEIWLDNGETHYLIIGSTGSGKTTRIVDPLIKILAKKGESIVMTDPKGELYRDNGELLRSLGYDIVILNFRDPHKGNSWNPLKLPLNLYKEGNKDKAIELLDDLALNILYEEKSGNADPFWEKTSADYFTGLSLGLFEDADASQVNLNSINLMSTVGEEKMGMSTYIKEYFNFKDPSGPAYINAASTINAPTDTKGSILSVFRQKIKLFSARENLSEMLAHNNFDMTQIGKKKTAVFMIIQDEKRTLHPLATIFVKQCYETLIDTAQEEENNGKLPIRTNFILDEFANMPPLKDVTTMVTAARSRQIRFNFIIQNFAQLYQVYGKENGETIKGNCGLIYLLSSELGALEEISKLCGDIKTKGKDGKDETRPLITVSDLQILKMGDVIIRRPRFFPFKTKIPFKTDYKFGFPNFGNSTLPQREIEGVNIFDVKNFVKQKKEEENKKIFEQLGGNELGSKQEMSNFPGMNFSPNMMPQNMSSGSPLDGLGLDDKNFDIDEMVRKIDARIAELEAEEALEKAKNTSSSADDIIDEVDSNDKEKIDDNKLNEIIENNNIVSASDNNEITDDQFFDDFFS